MDGENRLFGDKRHGGLTPAAMAPKFAHESRPKATRRGTNVRPLETPRYSSLVGPSARLALCRARAQKPVLLGLLSSLSPQTIPKAIAAFYRALKEAGFRWAKPRRSSIAGRRPIDRLPALATELVDLPVDHHRAAQGSAARREGRDNDHSRSCLRPPTIPWRPALSQVQPSGGNMTGVTWLGADLGGKNLEVLHAVAAVGRRSSACCPIPSVR